MISLKLTGTKNFMTHLLLSDTFDNFLFIEGEIVTFNTFTIDGYIQKAFYESGTGDENSSPGETARTDSIPQTAAGTAHGNSTAVSYDYALWKQLRELCFSMIRGKRTPLSFKFIFSLSPDNIAKLIQQKNLDFKASDVQGLYLNIRFDGNVLQCITGTSLKTFSMDKSLEREWDAMVPRFFDKKGLQFEVEE